MRSPQKWGLGVSKIDREGRYTHKDRTNGGASAAVALNPSALPYTKKPPKKDKRRPELVCGHHTVVPSPSGPIGVDVRPAREKARTEFRPPVAIHGPEKCGSFMQQQPIKCTCRCCHSLLVLWRPVVPTWPPPARVGGGCCDRGQVVQNFRMSTCTRSQKGQASEGPNALERAPWDRAWGRVQRPSCEAVAFSALVDCCFCCCRRWILIFGHRSRRRRRRP